MYLRKVRMVVTFPVIHCICRFGKLSVKATRTSTSVDLLPRCTPKDTTIRLSRSVCVGRKLKSIHTHVSTVANRV
jgi:hypothetical protein